MGGPWGSRASMANTGCVSRLCYGALCEQISVTLCELFSVASVSMCLQDLQVCTVSCVPAGTFGLDMISGAKKHFKNEMLVGVRVKKNDDISDIESYFEIADFVMVELDSKKIVDEKIVERAKQKNCEPIYLAKMPTLMKGKFRQEDKILRKDKTWKKGLIFFPFIKETFIGQ